MGCSRIVVEMCQQRRKILDLHTERKRNCHDRNIASVLQLSSQNNLGMSVQQRLVNLEQYDAVLVVDLVVIYPHDHGTVVEPIDGMSVAL